MINKIKYFFIILLLSPFLVFIVLIRPIILIRFGNFPWRIGMFTSAEIYLLQKNSRKSPSTFDIWGTEDHLMNKQLLIMLKRKFLIISHSLVIWRALYILSKYISIFSRHIIIFGFGNSSIFDERKLEYIRCLTSLQKFPPQMCLTKQEIQKGERMLEKFNIPKNAKIVCIASRDSAYLKKIYPTTNFSYHNYRDSDINNFIPAIKTLIKKNFYVVRMGKDVTKKINIKNSKFVDYPFHPLKSDFMDFFFSYKCFFWIGCNSGLDRLPVVFKKPMLVFNTAPILHIILNKKKTLVAPKMYMNSKNQKLSISKIFDGGLAEIHRTEDFKKKNIKLQELNSKQIKDITLEMLKLIKDSWKIKNKKDFKLQQKFKKIYLQKVKESKREYKNEKFNPVYSSSFLKKNIWLLK